MTSNSKFHTALDSFDIWANKHFQIDVLNVPEELQKKKKENKREFILEFESNETRLLFLNQNFSNWQQQQEKLLKSFINSQDSIIRPLDQSEADLLLIFSRLPYLWINASYNWIEEQESNSLVIKIYGNYQMYLSLNEINSFFEIERIHQSFFGYSGKNVLVGLLDSGIDTTHPDLQDKVVDNINVTLEPPGDLNGHGTFMASVVVGSGQQSESLYHGIAPAASILDIKIFNQEGQSTIVDVMVAIELLFERSIELRPKLLLMGGTTGNCHNEPDPLRNYIDLCLKNNMFVISPVGNFGPDLNHIGSPSMDSNVISIGSIDFSNQIPFFSARGIVGNVGNELSKPDFFVPGVKIVACRSFQTQIGLPYSPNDHYMILSGTSISAAIFTGFVCLLIEAYPEKTIKEIIELLRTTATKKEIVGLNNVLIPNIIGPLIQSNLLINRPFSLKKLIKQSSIISICLISVIYLSYFFVGLFF